ncbi:MAG: reverse transcriptase/maturase family protein [Bacteroidia bacterium]|nr:reverse transcriptase/maturase family protein [Bacteroidia bacterium]
MKEFEKYFSNDAIVSYLCKLRAKVAKSRNKMHLIHLLTASNKYNYHVNDKKKCSEVDEGSSNEFLKYQNEFLNDLNKLFPSRKKWVVLGSKSRKDKKTNNSLSSSDRNYYSLIKTIKLFRKKSPNEPWLVELDKFILDIQHSISSGEYKVNSPVLYPKLKDEINIKGINKCRPISLFTLKDRIILSLTNKYLTRLFDNYFEDCSYAFRSKKNKENTAVLTHHDCIKDVLDYRMKHQNEPLWVVECDMEKFYDSVNHKIIKELFNDLLELAKIDFPNLDFQKSSHLFFEFLDCYAFNKNAPSKTDLAYWASYKIPNGEFEWIENRFKELDYYNNIDEERIGVPQGGALSGLIANIVMNFADKEVLKTDVFYVRFCDDMLIIHPEFDICKLAKDNYLEALKGLKLVPHPFNSNLITDREKTSNLLPTKTLRPFWKGKSKGPYRWTSINDEGFPWIGFVGYELHHEGHIRVRKKSLHKELNKQEEVIDEIRKAVKYGMRKTKGSVTESAIHRLVGMSVGRVTIKNFDTVSNDLCWKNGFKALTMNKYSVQQIKQLDRNRNKLYYDLLKDLKEPVIEGSEKIEPKPRQLIHFNKPFSYYYQVLGR